MGPELYISNFINAYFLLFLFAYILSITLVYPHFSLLSIWVQIVLINLYSYFFQYSTRNLAKKLTGENYKFGKIVSYIICMCILTAAKFYLNIKQLSYTLILFLTLWTLSVDIFKTEGNESDDYNFGPSYYDMLFGTLKTNDHTTALYEIKNGIVFFLLIKLWTRLHLQKNTHTGM